MPTPIQKPTVPSLANMGLARNNLCEFFWTNVGMIFFNIILKKLFTF